jgi:hypothetical protein
LGKYFNLDIFPPDEDFEMDITHLKEISGYNTELHKKLLQVFFLK